MFSHNFKWLIYDRSSGRRVLSKLSTTRLYVDAEITVVDMDEDISRFSDGETIGLLDVYNNGYHIGGKLNVTAYQNFTLNSTTMTGQLGRSLLADRAKYEHRMNLSDVTLRIGLIVSINNYDENMKLNTFTHFA